MVGRERLRRVGGGRTEQSAENLQGSEDVGQISIYPVTPLIIRVEFAGKNAECAKERIPRRIEPFVRRLKQRGTDQWRGLYTSQP